MCDTWLGTQRQMHVSTCMSIGEIYKRGGKSIRREGEQQKGKEGKKERRKNKREREEREREREGKGNRRSDGQNTSD